MKFIFGVTVTARSPKNLIIFLFLKGINARIPSVADSRIIGGSRPSDKGGGAVIQTLRKGGVRPQKNVSAFRASVSWKNEGGGGRSPGSATENGGQTKSIAKYYATHGHEPSGSESTVGLESVSLERQTRVQQRSAAHLKIYYIFLVLRDTLTTICELTSQKKSAGARQTIPIKKTF